MKAGLYSAIDKKYAALEASIKLRFREAHSQITLLENGLVELKHRIAACNMDNKELRGEYETHTHRQTGMRGDDPADDYTTIPTDVEESRRKRTVERSLIGGQTRPR